MSTPSQIADINNTLGATLKGADKAVRWLDDQLEGAKKAQETAVKVEGYRLKRLMEKEIRQGAPGGGSFEPLSYIARRLIKNVTIMGGITQRQNPNRKPLQRLVHGVRYNVQTHPAFKMLVGFVQPGAGPHSVSKSWRRLADFHQRGFSRGVTLAQRLFITRRGAELGTVDGGSTPFFLRRETKEFHTPGRPIVEPFWNTHADQARQNIRNNFKAKMAGKRI